MTPADVLAPVTDRVGHLRWRVGEPGGHDVTGVELVAHPEHLATRVAATSAARGSTEPRVLASLWWQAYGYRVAGTTVAAWLVGGVAPDPAAPGAGVGLVQDRPASLLVDPDAALVSDLDLLVDRLLGGHLEPVARTLRAEHRLGWRLLWGNVAAGMASALAAVGTAPGAGPDALVLRERVDVLASALPDHLGGLGAWVPGRWDHRRRTCCLWWRTDAAAGARCGDCSLRCDRPSAAEARHLPQRRSR